MALDFSSVIGLPPMTVPLDEYVQALDRAFAPFSTTHHAITGHVVKIDGDRATIHAHVRAEH
ncbi:nuclear transport factor 2 family protein [Streptomyces griseoincarnatus]